ncbi:hypothetical protein RJ639_044073 [Escallonia herrerae]|uniref:Uncharacterized protein n=1 Tax=Escallonia herrerae TaxID=1293975 RepID=A0AA88WCL7_9ASTE|nr:hypothetical protein RJ639_044073 [Escallonia herrerae]
MDPPPKPSQSPSQSPPAHHQSDADEDDETVKQLKECSSLYLSLQDCLVKTNRNWKSCQMGMPSFIPVYFRMSAILSL